jgi:WD40 repeat protein
VRFRHPGTVRAVALTSDCKLVAASSDDRSMVIIWDRVTGRKLREIPADSRPFPPRHLRFSADGERLYGSLQQGRDWRMHAWDVETGTDAKDIPPMPAGRNVLGYSPDAREVVLLDQKGEIVRWDIEKGEQRGRYPKPDHDTGIAALVGIRLLVPQFDGQKVSMWDAAGKKQLWSAKMTRDKNFPILPIDFSPDGKLFAFEAPERVISVHESVSGKLVRQLKANVDMFYHSVCISPDTRTVAASNRDGSLRLWDLESGQERLKPAPQLGYVNVFFSPDSRIFAVSGNQAVLLWDTASGTRALPFRAHAWQVSSASFSPDGRMAATSSWPGGNPVVHLWDVQTGQPLRAFDTPSVTGSLEVAFSPDGRTLAAVGDTNGT